MATKLAITHAYTVELRCGAIESVVDRNTATEVVNEINRAKRAGWSVSRILRAYARISEPMLRRDAAREG